MAVKEQASAPQCVTESRLVRPFQRNLWPRKITKSSVLTSPLPPIDHHTHTLAH